MPQCDEQAKHCHVPPHELSFKCQNTEICSSLFALNLALSLLQPTAPGIGTNIKIVYERTLGACEGRQISWPTGAGGERTSVIIDDDETSQFCLGPGKDPVD